MRTNINIDLVKRIISFNIYVPFLCRAAEIITYPKPTANPNPSGIKTAPASQFIACWIKVSNISKMILIQHKEDYLTMLTYIQNIYKYGHSMIIKMCYLYSFYAIFVYD